MDFTLNTYKQLLITLKEQGYRFITFEQYCGIKEEERITEEKYIIMRHDVDKRPQNSLAVAQIEHDLGVTATYYFRVVPESNQPEYIKAIATLGHEIGYHYEDMAICNGDVEQAYQHFQKQLSYFRQFYPVRTICMHGSVKTRIDNRDLWKLKDYKSCGILGEPYLDIDYAHVLYLTDTGRRWDGKHVNMWDKIPLYQDEWTKQGWQYHTTDDIIQALNRNLLPPHIMMTTHPQRWTDNKSLWIKEYIVQQLKNIVKRLLIRF